MRASVHLKIYLVVFCVAALTVNCATSSAFDVQKAAAEETAGFQPSERTLLDARADFETKWQESSYEAAGPAPEPPGEDYRKIHYESPAGRLVAYLSKRQDGPGKRPVLIWAHGGFGGIGDSVWTSRRAVLEPFLEAGFVVMVPSWRGENDNPGRFEMYLGESEDLVAAVEHVAGLEHVDNERIYMAGHSAGATLVQLAALSTDTPRAAFSIGGAVSMELLFEFTDGKGYGNTPFDPDRSGERSYRSTAAHIEKLQIPTYYFEGAAMDQPLAAELTEERAVEIGVPFESYILDGGNHFDVLEPMARLIFDRVVDDTEDAVDLKLGQVVAQRRYDEATGSQTFYEPKDGNFLRQACQRGSCVDCHMLAIGYQYGLAGPARPGRAVPLYERGCEIGKEESCQSAAQLYFNGMGVDRDRRRGVELLADACRTADREPKVCLGVAGMYEMGQFVEKNRQKALEFLKLGCDRGHVDSCVALGTYRLSDPERRAQAKAPLSVGCEAGRTRACFALAQVYDHVEEHRDEKRAVELYRRACRNGDSSGCHELGVQYHKGHGVERDETMAADLYQRSCAMGNMLGCADIGNRMVEGRGTAKDPQRGVELLVKACRSSDNALACKLAGVVYENGEAGEVDLEKAAIFYRMGCKRGDGAACSLMGDMLIEEKVASKAGESAEKFNGKARRILKKECHELRSGADCNTYANLLADGHGGPKDMEEARAYWDRACRYGYQRDDCSERREP